jgi:hypothetical protein
MRFGESDDGVNCDFAALGGRAHSGGGFCGIGWQSGTAKDAEDAKGSSEPAGNFLTANLARRKFETTKVTQGLVGVILKVKGRNLILVIICVLSQG